MYVKTSRCYRRLPEHMSCQLYPCTLILSSFFSSLLIRLATRAIQNLNSIGIVFYDMSRLSSCRLSVISLEELLLDSGDLSLNSLLYLLFSSFFAARCCASRGKKGRCMLLHTVSVKKAKRTVSVTARCLLLRLSVTFV